MLYGLGLIEKGRLKKELPETHSVFLARMGDDEGSFRLLISALHKLDAENQIRVYCLNHPGDTLVSLHSYDLNTGEIK